MTFFEWLKRPFGQVTYVRDVSPYVTRLRASAPTVTPEEVAKLEAKWKQKPVDWEQLPV